MPPDKLKHLDTAGLCAAVCQHGTLVAEALSVAAYAHEGAFRRETRHGVSYSDPYIIHPLRNALRVSRFTEGDPNWTPRAVEELVIASLLHDTVEDAPHKVTEYYDATVKRGDGGYALAVIEEHFGAEVADAVRRVTNPAVPPGTSAEGKRELYLQHLSDAVVDHTYAYMTKVSDLVDNAGSLQHADPSDKRTRLALRYRRPVKLLRDRHHALGDFPVTRDLVRERLIRVSESLETILKEAGQE